MGHLRRHNDDLVLVFSVILLWRSTVLPTVVLCARNPGALADDDLRLISLRHQCGGFTGAWLGGVVFARTGSFDLTWKICATVGFAALGLIPAQDAPARPLARPA